LPRATTSGLTATTSGQTAPPPKTPARSKTPLRNARKQTPEANQEESLTTPARKQKQAGGGGGSSTEGKPEAAPVSAKNVNQPPPPPSKDKKIDGAEVAESLLPQVNKAVPPSPKVYIRKVKGKAKKS